MSLHDCLQRAIDSGDLPPRQARRAQALFAERLQVHAQLGQGAEAMAAEDVWIALRRENIRARRGVAMQAKAQMGIAEALARHRDSDGEANAASALRQLVEWGQSATHQSVESTRQALEQSYLRDVNQLVATHKRNIFGGVRQKARLANLVRELKGEASGDTHAKDMAAAVSATIERARREHNAAGGEIGKLEGYDLPHHWDRSRVARLAPDDFAARLQDQLDWGRIVDRDTEQPFTKSSAAARTAFLKRIHETIRTGGWNTREPSGVSFGSSLAKSRADHRVLHFNSANAWLEVNAELGTADPFSAVVEHLKGMARDTAQMRILGPNPSAGLEYARQAALKLANERPWQPSNLLPIGGKGLPMYATAEAEVKGVAQQAQRMLDMISGAANQPEMELFASFMAGTRQFLVAAKLGGALLSAVSDVGFLGMASRHVGIPVTNTLTRHLMAVTGTLADTAINLASLGLAQRQTVYARMARAGIIAESAASTGVVQARLMGEAYGNNVMARLSELTMRASGLTAWTDIGRGAFKLEFYGMLAENADRGFDAIDAPLRDLVFKARGITAADWDVIRATPLYRDKTKPEASFLIPDDIRRREDLDPEAALSLSLKLAAAVQEQMEFAVPSQSLRGKANVLVARPGTIGGELIRSTLMFKNFTITAMFNQLGRVFYHKVRGNRVANIAMLATVTTAAGLISLQLKEMAKGRDPRPLDGKTLWAAVLQGGGLGIFGDYLYSTENRFGGGFAGTVAGPVVGLANDAGGLLQRIVTATASGDPDKIDAMQRELVRFANSYSGPTNLWYLNQALDRMVWDNLTEWLDPDATKAFAAAEKKRVREYGNPAYWPPGQNLPSRLPDMSNLFAPATGAQP